MRKTSCDNKRKALRSCALRGSNPYLFDKGKSLPGSGGSASCVSSRLHRWFALAGRAPGRAPGRARPCREYPSKRLPLSSTAALEDATKPPPSGQRGLRTRPAQNRSRGRATGRSDTERPTTVRARAVGRGRYMQQYTVCPVHTLFSSGRTSGERAARTMTRSGSRSACRSAW